MPKPPKTTAIIDWDDNGQPVSPRFDDVYFSKDNGLQESRYVFIEASKLEERWKAFEPEHAHTFTIVETGFGTGLNFLAVWQLWNKCLKNNADTTTPTQENKKTDSCLHYISVEKYPLDHDALQKALSLWPELAVLSKILIHAYPPQPWSNCQRLQLSSDNPNIRPVELTLYFCDIQQALSELSPSLLSSQNPLNEQILFGEKLKRVDAWFLDGFTPAKNPEMWGDFLYKTMASNSRTYTTFATFTAASDVRRGLENAGFNCNKRAGYGKKREMLFGQFEPKSSPKNSISKTNNANKDLKHNKRLFSKNIDPLQSLSWMLKNPITPRNLNSAIVIGSGLAGSHSAYALAQKGFKVRVIEAKTLASGASSNLQGAVYTRLSDSDDPLSEFNQSAQLYADQFYQNTSLYKSSGDQCGVLHLEKNASEAKRFKRFIDKFNGPTPYFLYVDNHQAELLSGLALTKGGLFIKRSGWLNPQRVCFNLLQHNNIELMEQHCVESLNFENNQWQVNTQHGILLADICIIANAYDAKKLAQTSHLPLSRIRGQVTHIESQQTLSKLKTVICGEGYIAPSTKLGDFTMQDQTQNQVHCVGATFNLKNEKTELDATDHDKNIATLIGTLPELQGPTNDALTPLADSPGNVGFRCNTPDYFPVIGPVPVLDKVLSSHARLSKNANAIIDAYGEYYPQLYCCLGFGSRGLAYAPLAAALLADLVCGYYLPLSRNLYRYVHPARFAIRSLVKNKALDT